MLPMLPILCENSQLLQLQALRSKLNGLSYVQPFSEAPFGRAMEQWLLKPKRVMTVWICMWFSKHIAQILGIIIICKLGNLMNQPL